MKKHLNLQKISCMLQTLYRKKYQKIRRTRILVHQQSVVMNIVLLMYSTVYAQECSDKSVILRLCGSLWNTERMLVRGFSLSLFEMHQKFISATQQILIYHGPAILGLVCSEKWFVVAAWMSNYVHSLQFFNRKEPKQLKSWNEICFLLPAFAYMLFCL